MNFSMSKMLHSALVLAALLLAACGGGGGTAAAPAAPAAAKTTLMGGAMQGTPLSLASAAVSSVTGASGVPVTAGAADGAAATASFNNPYGITTDGTNLYVVDTNNNKIRKIVIATGAVSTLAGSPTGVAGSADGAGAAATFNSPSGITTDGTNLYVADSSNNKIRQIVIATGVVSTLAGSGAAGAADGAGATASFNYPYGITTDGTNLYVVDTNNNKIRKIVIATGVVSSVTGAANTAGVTGAADGAGAAATFNGPTDLTTDGTKLYVVDEWNSKIRQIVIATGVVSSVTGAANTASGRGAADGAAATASFYIPYGLTTDGTSLYVTDAGNSKIRQIVIATGVVSSVTGAANTAGVAGAADGAGATATFSNPAGITTDGTNLYVVDSNNNKIRKIR